MRRQDPTIPYVHVASQWLLGLLLVAALSGLFLAINGLQLTSAATGQRLLRRAVAVLTDLDAALPRIHNDLLEEAASSNGDTVRVPAFPIPIDIPVAEAATTSQAELRARLLEASARRVYGEGMAVLAAADPEAGRDIELISTAGAIDRGLGLITSDSHTRLRLAAAALGATSAVLATLLLAKLPSYGRLLAAGVAVLIASLPALAAAVALRFVFRTAQDGADPFTHGLLELGVGALGVPIRNYIALAALGAALLVLGMALAWAIARLSAKPFPSR